MLDQLLRLFPDLADLPPGTYAVGGVVRDLLLGRPPADADLACGDPLSCAEALARKRRRKVIRLGKEELIVYRVVAGEHVYDFTAIQGAGIDDDLSRRDFTINAMAVDLRSGALLDPFGGARDIEGRVIRMIRPENFDADPLRLLKAARMAMATGFVIDDVTLAAIRIRASAIESIAAERAGDELAIIFAQQRMRQALTLLVATGLDVPLFAGAAARLLAMAFWPGEPDGTTIVSAMALLLRERSHRELDAHAERWRWSEALRRQVVAMTRLWGVTAEAATDGDLAIALFDSGEEVGRAAPAALRILARGAEGVRLERVMISQPDLFETKALLTGDEIAAIASVARGPSLGRIKRALVEAQLRRDVRTREEAEVFVAIA